MTTPSKEREPLTAKHLEALDAAFVTLTATHPPPLRAMQLAALWDLLRIVRAEAGVSPTGD